ncbi:MAG: hypothetical protein FJX77_13400 [Armatimonadetes bacterium]|nr:hypothetical protein [Armatimonadota bacterium]
MAARCGGRRRFGRGALFGLAVLLTGWGSAPGAVGRVEDPGEELAARAPRRARLLPVPSDTPTVEREFRGVWVATVDNIDWPSRPGLPAERQQAELTALLDRAAALHLNAILFQVRPACDALYPSSLEPWSSYLTGLQGQAPSAPWDPLAFAVEEAHRRGLELHAWFNPFRAVHPSQRGAVSANHISRLQPHLVKRYGRLQWLDPGEPAAQDHSYEVVLDVLRRYDVDGIHFDDYFYPYPERNGGGRTVPFPDEPSWRAYVAAGGALSRDNWRRDNIDRFVQRVYEGIHREKPWVRFGISPFGIWRPGNPAAIRGFDAYAELYADARKWLTNGWVDYFTPQLYWKIDAPQQSYPLLLEWWCEQNTQNRHMWPGNYTSQVGAWPAAEIANQIRLTRNELRAGGNVHFSMKPLLQGRGGLDRVLTDSLYVRPALPPPSPWLDRTPPPAPVMTRGVDPETGARRVTWSCPGAEPIRYWIVRTRRGGAWRVAVQPAQSDTLAADDPGLLPDLLVVSAVDRCANEGPAAAVDPDPVRGMAVGE